MYSLCMLNCWSRRPPNLPCSLRVIVVEKDLDGRLEVLSGFHVDSSSISFRKRDVRRNDSSVRWERCRRRHLCEWEEVERRGGKEERKEKMEVGGKGRRWPESWAEENSSSRRPSLFENLREEIKS